jgi:hypothetical protein
MDYGGLFLTRLEKKLKNALDKNLKLKNVYL